MAGWRRAHTFLVNGVARLRRGHSYTHGRTSSAAVDQVGVERGRAVGRALKTFHSSDGLSSTLYSIDSSEYYQLEANNQVSDARLWGKPGEYTLENETFSAPDLKEVLGSKKYSYNGRDFLNVYYTTLNGQTVSETLTRKGRNEPWDRMEKAGGSYQSLVGYTGGRMVRGANGGFAFVGHDGKVQFNTSSGSESYELRRVFGDKLETLGRVISASGGDDKFVILQENEDGEKTVTAIRVWSTGRDDNLDIPGDVHIRVHSAPVNPHITDVYYEGGPDVFLGPRVKVLSGKTQAASLSLTEIERGSKEFEDTIMERKRKGVWKPPATLYQQQASSQRRL